MVTHEIRSKKWSGQAMTHTHTHTLTLKEKNVSSLVNRTILEVIHETLNTLHQHVTPSCDNM